MYLIVHFFIVLANLFDRVFFFFSSRRRHTRYIGDWSSDACSSDLWVLVPWRCVSVIPYPDTRPSVPTLSRSIRFTSGDAMVTIRSSSRRRLANSGWFMYSMKRSEERRVGREGRSIWRQCRGRKKEK